MLARLGIISAPTRVSCTFRILSARLDRGSGISLNGFSDVLRLQKRSLADILRELQWMISLGVNTHAFSFEIPELQMI